MICNLYFTFFILISLLIYVDTLLLKSIYYLNGVIDIWIDIKLLTCIHFGLFRCIDKYLPTNVIIQCYIYSHPTHELSYTNVAVFVCHDWNKSNSLYKSTCCRNVWQHFLSCIMLTFDIRNDKHISKVTWQE